MVNPSYSGKIIGNGADQSSSRHRSSQIVDQFVTKNVNLMFINPTSHPCFTVDDNDL